MVTVAAPCDTLAVTEAGSLSLPVSIGRPEASMQARARDSEAPRGREPLARQHDPPAAPHSRPGPGASRPGGGAGPGLRVGAMAASRSRSPPRLRPVPPEASARPQGVTSFESDSEVPWLPEYKPGGRGTKLPSGYVHMALPS
jgi:hypothetical protein